MPAALIIQLIATFGPSAINLITTLIQKWETNAAVTSAEWAALTASLQQSSQDRMKAALTAAGMDLNGAQAQSLIALAK